MKKIYQRKVDKNNGDCMQAAIASLFEEDYENVPPFIELGDDWFSTMWNFVKERGYEYSGTLHNTNWTRMIAPTAHCFGEPKWHRPSTLTKSNLVKSGGVDGFFFAVVLSPKFFNWRDGLSKSHAVICDTDFNIVHDPSPAYKDIIRYPLADVLRKNGIIYVYDFVKVKT